MRIVPISWQALESSTVVEGVPIEELFVSVTGLIPPALHTGLLERDLLLPRLIDRQGRGLGMGRDRVGDNKQDPKITPQKTGLEAVAKVLASMGLEGVIHADKLVIPTSIPGMKLEVEQKPDGMRAQLIGADGRLHAELTHFTNPADIVAFLHTHQVGPPKPNQKAETLVRQPLANKQLVDIGL